MLLDEKCMSTNRKLAFNCMHQTYREIAAHGILTSSNKTRLINNYYSGRSDISEKYRPFFFCKNPKLFYIEHKGNVPKSKVMWAVNADMIGCW